MAADKKRGVNRIEVALPSILRSSKGGRAVEIRNLAANGVMIVGEPGLAPGEAVELHISNIGWIDACVAWSIDARAGLAFHSPIDLDAALAGQKHSEAA